MKDGVSGHVRETVDELVECVKNLKLSPHVIRGYVEKSFSVERMTKDYINLYTEILRNDVTEAERIVA